MSGTCIIVTGGDPPHPAYRAPPAVGRPGHRGRLRSRPRRRARARRRPRPGRPRLGDQGGARPRPAGAGIPVEEHPVAKDQTDLELAIDAAARRRRRPHRRRQRRRRPARPPARRPAGAGRAGAHRGRHTRRRRGRRRARPGWRRSTARDRQAVDGPARRAAHPAGGRRAGRRRAHRGPALPAARRAPPARLGPGDQQRAPRRRRRGLGGPRAACSWSSPTPWRCRHEDGALVVLAALLVVAAGACGDDGGSSDDSGSGGDAVTLRLVAYDSFLLSDATLAAVHGRHRHQGGDRHRRRRRRGREPGDAHQGQARGRRAVGRRQHPALPSRRRGHLRALRVARAGQRRPGLHGAGAGPRGHPGRLRRRVRELRQGLVRGRGHRTSHDAGVT